MNRGREIRGLISSPLWHTVIVAIGVDILHLGMVDDPAHASLYGQPSPRMCKCSPHLLLPVAFVSKACTAKYAKQVYSCLTTR